MVKQVKPLEYKEVKKEMDEGEYVEVEFKDEGGERMDPNTSKAISIVLSLIAGICLIVAVIALAGMFSDFAEFGAYLEQLKAQLQMMYPFTWEQYWNDPQVQKVIADGYAQLAREPLTLAIPMFIIAGVLLVVSRVVVNKSKGSREIKQVKPITPMPVKQVSPITESEPIKKSKIKQVEPITQ